MNKKIYNIFPVNLHEYEIDNLSVNNQVINILEKEEFIKNGYDRIPEQSRCYQTTHDLHKRIEFINIISFIKESIRHYKEELEYDCGDLEITSCWANKYPRYTVSQQIPHIHKMSLISGVYYLTPGAPTYFNDPMFQRTQTPFEVFNNEINIRQSVFPAEPGKLVLFPSWLEHGTYPHRESFDRWSISFNVLATGKLNQKFNTSGIPSCEIYLK